MKKRSIKKVLRLLLVVICLSNIMQTVAFAAGFNIKDAWNYARSFPASGSKIEEEDIKDLQAAIYNILFIAGVIIAVIWMGILGIQFITSAPEGKAEVKEKMVPFVIGCIVVFAGFTIWKITVNIVQQAKI